MSGLEFNEKRHLANKLFAIIDERQAEEQVEDAAWQAGSSYDDGYEKGYDAGWVDAASRIAEVLEDVAELKSNADFANGMIYSAETAKRIGNQEEEKAA